jgi:uncharacterized membrane protein
LLACTVVIALLAAGFAGACNPAEETGSRGIAGATALAPGRLATDGYVWGDDRRLTDNSIEDGHPQLAVDRYGISGVTWSRPGLCMWKKIDRDGFELVAEKPLYYYDIPEQHSGYHSPNIGVDSEGNYHVCAGPNAAGVYYAKYDGNGSNLIPLKSVPNGASSPHNPAIAVNIDDRVDIIYEDYRFGYAAQAITFAQLDLDGNVLKDGIRISEATWNCEGSTLITDGFGWIHATFINTAQGCYHGVLNAEGNPMPQAPPVYLYGIQSWQTEGPGIIASDGLGGVHVLWNTGGTKTGTLMYMKLDPNGNKLASGADGAGIPLTPSATCRGIPSIQGDPDGNALAVWSDLRNGYPQLLALRIQNGQENDTGLAGKARCLVDNPGTSALEPALSIDSEGCAHLAWKDNRDGNFEIYYKSGYHYGVEARMTDDDRVNLLLVHPNETRTANLTVTNTGNFTGTFHLSLTSEIRMNAGWKIEVNETELEIESRGLRNLTVRVTGAPVGLDGDYIDTRIIAAADCDPWRNSTVEFRSYLTADFSFTLNCSDPSRTIEAGNNARYILLVENTGDMDNDIELIPDGTDGWRWVLSEGTVRLRPGESQNVTLTVAAPGDAIGGDVGILFITGRSVQDPGTCTRLFVRAEVPTRCHLEIHADKDEEYVDFGETAVYTITVWNRGNLGGRLAVNLETDCGLTEWQVILESTMVTAASGEGASVRLLVSPPQIAAPGSRLAVKVICTDSERRWSASCTTVTRFWVAHAMEVAVSPKLAAVNPGGFCTFRVNLTNLGKDADGAIPGIFSASAGLVLSYRTLDGKVLEDCRPVPVERNGTAGFEIIVAAAPDAPVGNSTIAGYVVDGGGNRYPLEMEVRVDQAHNVSLFSSFPEQKGAPGRTVSFPFIAKNRGNGPDVLGLNATGLPEGWPRPRFCDAGGRLQDRVELNASEMRRLTALVQVPATAPQDALGFNLTATSEHGANATLQVILALEKSDLVVSGIRLFGPKVRLHRSVMVRLSVENRGDAEAENVTLAYYINGTLRSNRSFGTLAAGETAIDWLDWMPEAGDNILVFVVDPDGKVSEQNESNNCETLLRSVHDEPPSDQTDSSITVYVVAFPVVSAIILIAVWMRRRSFKI